MTIPTEKHTRFTFTDEVLLQQFEEKALLLDLKSERVYQLNETGAQITAMIAEGRSIGEIIGTLQQTYSTTPEFEEDVQDLLRELWEQKLIRVAS